MASQISGETKIKKSVLSKKGIQIDHLTLSELDKTLVVWFQLGVIRIRHDFPDHSVLYDLVK
jgi:hypothetical protein